MSTNVNLIETPSYLKILSNLGGEDLLNENLVMPYIKVIQKTSAELEEGAAVFGDIINSITKEKLTNSDGTLDIIILKHFINYKIFEESKLKDTSNDGIHWTNGSVILAEDLWQFKFYNFLVVLNKEISVSKPSLYILSMGKTSATTGKYLVNLLYQKLISKGLPIFAKPFTLTTTEEQKDGKQKYKVFQIKSSSIEWTPEEFVTKLVETRKFLDSKKVVELVENTNF